MQKTARVAEGDCAVENGGIPFLRNDGKLLSRLDGSTHPVCPTLQLEETCDKCYIVFSHSSLFPSLSLADDCLSRGHLRLRTYRLSLMAGSLTTPRQECCNPSILKLNLEQVERRVLHLGPLNLEASSGQRPGRPGSRHVGRKDFCARPFLQN